MLLRVQMVTGGVLPAASRARRTTCTRPKQQGTSILTMVISWMSFSLKIAVSLATLASVSSNLGQPQTRALPWRKRAWKSPAAKGAQSAATRSLASLETGPGAPPAGVLPANGSGPIHRRPGPQPARLNCCMRLPGQTKALRLRRPPAASAAAPWAGPRGRALELLGLPLLDGQRPWGHSPRQAPRPSQNLSANNCALPSTI